MSIKRKGFLYQITLWGLLCLSLLVLVYISPILVKPENIHVDDFSQFWAAGQLNISGGNPYSPEEITQTIQNIGGTGSTGDVVSIMLNPPWTLALIMPFSLINYSTSRLLWLLINVALVLISVKLLWDIYEGHQKYRIRVLFLIFLFSPTLAALQKGQFTPFILFGLVMTLYIIKTRKEFWMSGIFIALVSFKPQLVYLIWIALVLWTIGAMRWQLLGSTIAAILALTLIAIVINRDVLNQYVYSMSVYPFSEWATPTIGSSLRLIFGLDKYWLQYLPMAIGTVIYTVYWIINRGNWSFVEEIPLIIVFSMLTTAYAWTYDAILFIIPIVHASIYAIKHYSMRSQSIIFLSLLIISILNIALHIHLNDFWFMWLFPLLFLWYLFAQKLPKTHVIG